MQYEAEDSCQFYQRNASALPDIFDVSPELVRALWQQSPNLLVPEVLLQTLINLRQPTTAGGRFLNALAARLFRPLRATAAYERMDAMIGLADFLAQKPLSPAPEHAVYLVQLDIINCHGVSRHIGAVAMRRLFRLCNEVFLNALNARGASCAFAFDSNESDDFKMVVVGLSAQVVAEALDEAQASLDERFLFAAAFPHSKYDDRSGLGVAYGFCPLGEGKSAEENELLLWDQVDTTRAKSFRRQQSLLLEGAGSTTLALPSAEAFFANLRTASSEEQAEDFSLNPEACDDSYGHDMCDPVVARLGFLHQLSDREQLTACDRDILLRLGHYYFRCDDQTAVERGRFLQEDAKFLARATQAPVSIASLKLENLAGINALLSLHHSSLVLRDFGPLLRRHMQSDPLGANGVWIYHRGRNTFNLLLPGRVPRRDVEACCNRLAGTLDRAINSRTVADYYASVGARVRPGISPKTGLMDRMCGWRFSNYLI